MKSIKFTIGAPTTGAHFADTGEPASAFAKVVAVIGAMLAGYLLALAMDSAFAAEPAHEVGEIRDDGYVWTEFTHTETVPVTERRKVVSVKHVADGCGEEFGYYGGYNHETGEKLPGGIRSKQGDLIDWDYNARELQRYSDHSYSVLQYVHILKYDPDADRSGCLCKGIREPTGNPAGGAWVDTSWYCDVKVGEETKTVVDFACWATPEGYHDPNCTNPNHTGHDDPNASATPTAPSTQPGTDTGSSAAGTVTVYRLYNPNDGDHHYTTDAHEYEVCKQAGWIGEGIGWNSPAEGSPVHRLYNRWSGEHHYTTDAHEKAVLVKAGWTYEGVGWMSPASGTPVYRLYNPYKTGPGAHHYTTDAHERDVLVKLGWRYEGVCWYAL